MPCGLFLAIVLIGLDNGPAKIDPDQVPPAPHRSMELDDLDREILRQHDAVTMKRA